MKRHGIPSATFVGHSLGSVYLSWVIRLRPNLVASAVFVDPIVFLLHHHKVRRASAPSATYPRLHSPPPTRAASATLRLHLRHLPAPAPPATWSQVAHSFLYEKPLDSQSVVENYFVKSEQRIVSCALYMLCVYIVSCALCVYPILHPLHAPYIYRLVRAVLRESQA